MCAQGRPRRRSVVVVVARRRRRGGEGMRGRGGREGREGGRGRGRGAKENVPRGARRRVLFIFPPPPSFLWERQLVLKGGRRERRGEETE